MFYQESEIDEHLRCQYCKTKYNDSRLVDCGGSLCKMCIDLLIKDDANGFNCPLCESYHQIPANGYWKIENIAKLCGVKPKYVSRGAAANVLNAKLAELKQNLYEFSNLIEFSADKITEHCTYLRNEVQLSSEKLIESIKEQNMELIAQIDVYESDVIANYDISNEYKMRLEKLLHKTNGIHSNSMDYLRQFELNEDELKQASTKVKTWQENLNHERGLFLNQIFNGRLLKFVENEIENKPNLIGRFEIDESHLVYQKQLNQLKMHELDLIDHCTEMDSVNSGSLRAQILANENICIMFQCYEDIFLVIFDSKLNKLCSEYVGENSNDKHKLAKLNSSPVLCLINQNKPDGWNPNFTYKPYESTLVQYDDKLNVLNKITVTYEIKAVHGFDSRLYCLASTHEINRQVFVYDANLKQVMSIGQHEDLTKPFYISNSFEKMRVCEMYFVFLDGKQVVFVNRQTGLVDKKFNFDSFDFMLYGDGMHAFKYDGENCNMVKFDFNGDSQLFSLNKANLDARIKKKLKLIDCVNGKFIFYNESNCSLVF